MKAKAKLLLVEDDYYLGAATQKRLESYGYSVVHCADAETAWVHFQKVKFDLCLIDIVLPRENGLELTKQIRGKDKEIPICILTAKDTEADKIRGFICGCDDYLLKPYNIQELVLRIKVWLKRSKPLSGNNTFQYRIADFIFDYNDQIIILANGKKMHVSALFAQLFKFYLDNPNKLLTRQHVLLNVWGREDHYLSRSMDVYNTQIRKLFPQNKASVLVNLHGRGFIFYLKRMEVYVAGKLIRSYPEGKREIFKRKFPVL